MLNNRSCDFPPNEENDVTTILSLSDSENATAEIIKNAHQNSAFCLNKEKVVARRSYDFPPKESDVISLQSLRDAKNAKTENKRSYGMEDEILNDLLGEDELATLPSPVIQFKF